MRIDAHCHTDCSDGNLTIEQRIALIKACGYEAATITDHDFISTAQVERAKNAAGDVPYIPGIELSLSHEDQVVHLLGYFVSPENESLQKHLLEVQRVDREQTIKLLEYFKPKGACFDIEDLISDSLHTFYSLMLVKRLAREMFDNDPRKCMPAFLEAMKVKNFSYPDFAPWDVRDAIDLIHKSGGIAVLAHPGGIEDAAMRTLDFLVHDEQHIKKYVGWGLDGIEVLTPVHSKREKVFYQNLVDEYHLLATSGSDCHGDDPYLGPALMGHFTEIPANAYEMILDCYQNKHLNI
jgi:predicted metal-dependent phosphoesterase TrpH